MHGRWFSQLPSQGRSLRRATTRGWRNRRTRRGFGWVRTLPSGRYQASYLDPTGTRITAKAVEDGKVVPLTFLDKKTAEAWLSLRQTELIENRWRPPQAREPEETVFGERATISELGRTPPPTEGGQPDSKEEVAAALQQKPRRACGACLTWPVSTANGAGERC